MFSNSTQRKYWTFSDENELQRLRDEANQKYTKAHKMKEEMLLAISKAFAGYPTLLAKKKNIPQYIAQIQAQITLSFVNSSTKSTRHTSRELQVPHTDV
ncbi:hypothetical protein J6590_083130 [Homalodisca vitripennis]|nr:hypothetical protein J6590_083130 [Homalodisca vitripennis]